MAGSGWTERHRIHFEPLGTRYRPYVRTSMPIPQFLVKPEIISKCERCYSCSKVNDGIVAQQGTSTAWNLVTELHKATTAFAALNGARHRPRCGRQTASLRARPRRMLASQHAPHFEKLYGRAPSFEAFECSSRCTRPSTSSSTSTAWSRRGQDAALYRWGYEECVVFYAGRAAPKCVRHLERACWKKSYNAGTVPRRGGRIPDTDQTTGRHRQ